MLLGACAKVVACSVLSIFGLCTNKKDFEKNIGTIMVTQQQFHDVSRRIQTKSLENFFLGKEMKETQDRREKVTEVVDKQLWLLEKCLLEIKGVFSHL